MALASTSEESAMPTAIYGSIPKNVISIGLITAAALMPANPVPRPAPIPAKKVTIIVKNNDDIRYLPPFKYLIKIIFYLFHTRKKSLFSGSVHIIKKMFKKIFL